MMVVKLFGSLLYFCWCGDVPFFSHFLCLIRFIPGHQGWPLSPGNAFIKLSLERRSRQSVFLCLIKTTTDNHWPGKSRSLAENIFHILLFKRVNWPESPLYYFDKIIQSKKPWIDIKVILLKSMVSCCGSIWIILMMNKYSVFIQFLASRRS